MRRIAVGLAGLLIIAGCTSSDPKAAHPSVASKSPDSTPVPLKEGHDFSVIGTLPSKIHGGSVSYRGLLDAETAYGVAWRTVDGGMNGEVVRTDLRTGKLRDVGRVEPGDDIGAVVAAPGWVVWLELQKNWDDLSSWTLFSYEVATKKVRQLAVAPMDQHHYNIHQLEPSISDGTVYISAVKSTSRNGGTSIGAAYSVPLDGASPLKLLVRGSIFTEASDGYLFFDEHGHLQKRDLSTGVTTAVAKSCRPDFDECHWGVGAGTLVWDPNMEGTGEETAPDAIHVLAADGSEITIDPNVSGEQFFRASKTWVSYVGQPNIDFVYRIPEHTISLLPAGWHLASASGEVMVWNHGHGDSETYEFVRLL